MSQLQGMPSPEEIIKDLTIHYGEVRIAHIQANTGSKFWVCTLMYRGSRPRYFREIFHNDIHTGLVLLQRDVHKQAAMEIELEQRRKLP